ncbi:MAG TPA: Spy/CpxP family protein refolding chaperone, partial [Thermoanaerobaculia bacterium]|nr:Spy/CpxP family protein refolding chaperone [Thermoanaerobaculia bacterium]
VAIAAVPARHRGVRDGAAIRERVATILDLSDAQVAQWSAIQTATRERMQPLAAQRRANAAALRAEMTDGQPDPARVGELVIANRQIRVEMRELRTAARGQFEAILTPEQKAKAAELKELRQERVQRRRMR